MLETNSPNLSELRGRIDEMLRFRQPAWTASTRYEFEQRCLREARTLPLGNDRVLACVLGTQKILITTADLNISAHLAFDGFWESWISHAICRAVRPGWRCIDVGANCGYFSLLLGTLTGPTGKVWAFEPNPHLAELLKISLSLNGLNHVQLMRQAATESPGQVTLSIPPGASINGTINPMSGAEHQFVVEAVPLDHVCGNEPIDFVKIDVEGAEEQVWRGMKTIRSFPKVRILLEFNAGRYADPARFISEIQKDGFSLRYVDHDGLLTSVNSHRLTTERVNEDWMLWLERA